MPAPRKPTRYIRRNERVGTEVHTHYLGSVADPVTRVLVQYEDLAEAQRDANRDSAESELVLQERLEICQKFLSTKVTRLVWRLRRQIKGCNAKSAKCMVGKGKMPSRKNRTSNGVSVSRDDWDEIVEDATLGDEEALEELKGILRYNPEICERLGDLSRHVQHTLIDIIGAESVATRESVKIEIEKLRSRLVGHRRADPLEQLLLEHIVTTMLDLSVQQIGSSQPHVKETIKRRWERRMERAQKRHLAAIKALLELRESIYGGDDRQDMD